MLAAQSKSHLALRILHKYGGERRHSPLTWMSAYRFDIATIISANMCHFRAYHLTNHRFVCMFIFHSLSPRAACVHQSHPSVFALAGGYQSFSRIYIFRESTNGSRYNPSTTTTRSHSQQNNRCVFVVCMKRLPVEILSSLYLLLTALTIHSVEMHTVRCRTLNDAFTQTQNETYQSQPINRSAFVCDGLCSIAADIDDKCIYSASTCVAFTIKWSNDRWSGVALT